MDKFLTAFGATILILIIVFIAAVIGGTILWLLWPCVLAVFPGLLANGTLAATISWKVAVGFVWVIGIFKSNSSSTKKD